MLILLVILRFFKFISLEITCPQLPLLPHGMHDNVCNGASSKCQSICTMSCEKGFKLTGNLYITCQGDGKWSGLPGKCEGS